MHLMRSSRRPNKREKNILGLPSSSFPTSCLRFNVFFFLSRLSSCQSQHFQYRDKKLQSSKDYIVLYSPKSIFPLKAFADASRWSKTLSIPPTMDSGINASIYRDSPNKYINVQKMIARLLIRHSLGHGHLLVYMLDI